MSKDLLRIDGMSKNYKQGGRILPVLKSINMTFQQGESYAITGASGSGKSTLLYILGGLELPSSGNVFWNDQNISMLHGPHLFRREVVGFVFQFHYLIRELTVLENVMLMGQIKKDVDSVCKKRAKNILEEVGLTFRMGHYPHQLSGGEQQRVSIARAIYNKPKFLLADEPTGNLDAHNAQVIMDILIRAQRQWDMGIVICSHDKEVYSKMNTVYSLHEGELAVAKET